MNVEVTISSRMICPNDDTASMKRFNEQIKLIERGVKEGGGRMAGVTCQPETGFTASFTVPLGYAENVFQKIRKAFHEG